MSAMSADELGKTETAAEPPVEPAEGAAPPPTEPDELTRLRREVEELRERNLRLLAEAQNTHKRAQREKQEALRFAESALAGELLHVLDNLERASDAANTATEARPVADGVRIVLEHFRKVLADREIRPIDAVGKPFDPTFHQAMLQQPSDEYPAGTVLQELARGYTMHERVLRPARVIVSTGPAAGGASAREGA
jgi:molecular chaperone GrpE